MSHEVDMLLDVPFATVPTRQGERILALNLCLKVYSWIFNL
jgi:hypothetical protein